MHNESPRTQPPDAAAALRLLDDLESRIAQLRDLHKQSEQRTTHLDQREIELARQVQSLKNDLESVRNATQHCSTDQRERRRVTARRLRRCRIAMRRPVERPPSAPHIAVEDIGRERKALREVKQLLEQSELEMIRRWSHHRGIVTASMIMMTLVMLGVSSIHVADRFSNPIWGTSMVVQMPREQWEQRTSSNAVLQQVINRYDNIGSSNVGQLKRYLTKNMSVKSPNDNQLTITLSGRNQQQSLTLLNALGEVAVVQSPFAKDAQPTRVVTPAKQSDQPISDDRYIVACKIFGALVGATFLLVIICRFVIRRARRVFDAKARAAMAALDEEEIAPTPVPIHGKSGRQPPVSSPLNGDPLSRIGR